MSDRPHRVQLSRKKGWRMPENTVKVARPGPFGNPFSVAPKHWTGTKICGGRYVAVPTIEDAIECYRIWLVENEVGKTVVDAARSELAGKNLACWCRLDQPCHADVLLELANDEP